MNTLKRTFVQIVLVLGLALILTTALASSTPQRITTATPVQHVVVIFDENISFDHYFGTYPNATNPMNEPVFTAAPNTPGVNGFTPALLNNNPNLTNPFRLDRSMAMTCDNDNHYTDE